MLSFGQHRLLSALGILVQGSVGTSCFLLHTPRICRNTYHLSRRARHGSIADAQNLSPSYTSHGGFFLSHDGRLRRFGHARCIASGSKVQQMRWQRGDTVSERAQFACRRPSPSAEIVMRTASDRPRTEARRRTGLGSMYDPDNCETMACARTLRRLTAFPLLPVTDRFHPVVPFSPCDAPECGGSGEKPYRKAEVDRSPYRA